MNKHFIAIMLGRLIIVHMILHLIVSSIQTQHFEKHTIMEQMLNAYVRQKMGKIQSFLFHFAIFEG